MNILNKWCSCDKQGTCLGCLIEAETLRKFGELGLTHLSNQIVLADQTRTEISEGHRIINEKFERGEYNSIIGRHEEE